MKYFSTFVFLLTFTSIYSQNNEEITTAEEVIDTIYNVTTHSIKKATIFSAIMPGAGQVYNHFAMPKKQKKAHWKVPLIYAGLGLTGYLALNNNSEQKALKQEYNNRTQQNIISTKYANYDNTAIIMLYQQTLNRRDLLFIAFGFVYVLQVVDAAVEAHFVNFEISQDLTLKISPQIFSTTQTLLATNYFPIGLSFKLRFN